MPIYTYRCNQCDHHFDIFQHFYEDSLTECPVCGKNALQKVYTPVGIVFKGSGFYATDHRSPSGMLSHTAEQDSSESSAAHAEKSAAAESGESAASSESSSSAASGSAEHKPASEPRKSGKKNVSKE